MNSKKAIWAGRVISGLAVLFLTVDGVFKLMAAPEALETSKSLGFGPQAVFNLGILELVLVALYVVPRSAVLGAVLFTGYLGGAVCTHVIHHDPLFSHVLFPTYIGALLWGGLFLRDARVRALNPLRSPSPAPSAPTASGSPASETSTPSAAHRAVTA